MHNIPFILLAIAAVVTGLVIFSRTPKGRQWFSKLAIEAPLFGKIKLMAFVAIFCKTLATLIGSGVSVLESFNILSGMTGNEILRNGVLSTRERLIEGMSISKSMEASGFFPNVAIKMAQIGEQSGSLSSVLDKTSQYYEKRVDSLVSAMLVMLEPILIITVGAIVLVVILAMYLPIFSLSV
jgi:type IV pilus assembly protein PilC